MRSKSAAVQGLGLVLWQMSSTATASRERWWWMVSIPLLVTMTIGFAYGVTFAAA